MSMLSALWARRRDRPLFVAVTLGTLAVLLVYPVVDLWLRAETAFAEEFVFRDFTAYERAVERWQAGESIYRRRADGGFWGTYLYPPVAILLFLPFVSLFDHRTAPMVWLGVSALLLWVGLQALVSELGYDLRVYERVGLAWLIAGFHPVILGAKLGQTALFTTALLSFAAAAMIRGERGESRTDGPPRSKRGALWSYASGAFTAVVGIVKFAYAPVGAHLLRSRERMAGALLTVPPVAWASIRFFGLEAHRTYVAVLQWGVGKGSGGARSPTLWLPPYYKPLSWFPASQALRALACLAVIGLAVLAAARARRLVFALGVTAFPLLTPQTYVYYLAALLPAAVILLAEEVERDGRPVLVVAGVLLAHGQSYGLKFLVHNVPDAVPAFEALEPHYLLLQPGLWGNALLFGLAAVRVAQTVESPAVVADRLDRA